MAGPDERPSGEDEAEDDGGRRKALIALLVVIALIVISLYVGHVLKTASDIQDCAMSGRTNCAPISTNRN